MDDLIILKTYDQAFLANIDVAKLNDEGIECFLKDENTIAINPLWSNMVGGIKLMIRQSDFEKAASIFDKNEYAELKKAFDEQIETQLTCPNCGSLKVHRKYSILAGLFFGLPLATTMKKYVCNSCKHVWVIK